MQIGRFVFPDGDEAGWIDDFCFDLLPGREMDYWELVGRVFDEVKDDPVSEGCSHPEIASRVCAILDGVPRPKGLSNPFIDRVRLAETKFLLLKRLSF